MTRQLTCPKTSQDFCKQQGADLKPVLEADGSFNGKCDRADSSGKYTPLALVTNPLS